MGFSINIDFAAIKKNTLEDAKKQLDEFADRVVEGVKSRTPEDTQTLLHAIKKTEQIYTGTKLLQQVKDTEDLDYTGYVEYGVSTPRNYHKPKGNVFLPNAMGAGMFRKTYADMKDKFNK